ncbi:MAG: DUF4886 domain-containing protein [Tannerellaceae bacterium]|jgi:hypothetical protein|nr:DUF4886 domain-containing protein [Tannerellaceae bacterium]
MKQISSKFFLIALFIACGCLCIQGKDVIRILAIGNSFSEDAAEQYLYELAQANGDSLIIGHAYIGGCSLELHWNNISNNEAAYSYRKIVGGTKTISADKVSVKHCIEDEPWDYISLQQASPLSGLDSSYWPLPKLIAYVKKTAGNPNVEILFHQTWAYSQQNTHTGFKNYNDDQMTMYRAIIKTVKKEAEKNHIKRIIPSGTAIQNGRTSRLGDNFCRDGYHLSLTLGRYTAACTWLETFTGKSAVGNTFAPEGVSPQDAQIAQAAAHYAVVRPDTVTSMSAYKAAAY